MKKTVITVLKNLFCILLFVFLAGGFYAFTHISRELTTAHYTVWAGVSEPVRIVHLSDLHNREFEDGNALLVSRVRQLCPDLIVMTGDMVNQDDSRTDIVRRLAADLSEITDVYCCMGNHEKVWVDTFGTRLIRELKDAGVILVDTDYIDFTLKGTDFRIGGYMGYYGAPVMTTPDREEQKRETAFMRDFEDTDRYKILLDHIPTSWLIWDYLEKYPVDLVLSGHLHGGQIVLPAAGPVFAPYIGFFPGRVRGIFTGSLGTCIVSSGLGSEHGIPRINNPAEIVCIDLIPAD